MKLPLETQLKLKRFVPRSYQWPIIDAIEKDKYKRVLAILPRRAGKDMTAFNIAIRQCLRKVCVVYYIFPTFAQAKRVIWDSINNAGERVLDYIPPELITSKNSQEMKIRFVNGSLLQLVGSDNIDALMGTNPYGCIFSEYALQDPRAYQFIRPILAANDGWALFISTPRGRSNHLYSLYEIARESDTWKCIKLSLDETQHISEEVMAQERMEMSDDLIQQEYYTSFDAGIEGAYYAKYVDKMRLESRIGDVAWEAGFPVHSAWDLGVSDSTIVIFFQHIGTSVRIIDVYENSKVGLEHYVKVLQQKPYTYGKHIAPHDIKVKELGTGMTRLEKARQLGIRFVVAPNISIVDGIESVRSMLGKTWIDESKCEGLIKALDNYRQEYDAKKKIYKQNPLHDWSSHWCFTGDTKILTRSGMRQIINIRDNDEVLTLEGWQKCTRAIKTKKNAKLVEVKFVDGTLVKCTPDHLFLTESGWKSAKSLTKGTRIQSSLIASHNTSRGHCIDYGKEKDISLKEGRNFTELFGNQRLEKYRKTATFITKIAIPPTITYGILNAWQKKSIYGCRAQTTLSVKRRVTLLLNGIDLKKEGFGIKDKPSEVNLGQNGKEKQKNVFTAQKSMKHLLEKMDTHKNFVTQTAKPLIIENVKRASYREDVYDIAVPGIRHFSLSNGAIVHNCDALRYLAVSLPRTKDGHSSKEEIDKRYYETLYGSNRSVPPAFR